MNTAKQKMMERVKALLDKTIANGCTEAEAFAALAKAQELMQTYEISEAELGSLGAEAEQVKFHYDHRDDPYRIRTQLASSVSRFCRCRGWRGNDYKVAMCGLESDVIFAQWLLDTLTAFVLRSLKNHQAKLRAQGLPCPRIIGSSFVVGAVIRIQERLKELTPKEVTDVSIGGNSLVVSRKALITKAMADAGIRLSSGRAGRRYINQGALNAGRAAGDAARFDRPVGAAGGPLLIGRG